MAFPSPARVGLFGISACLEAPSEKDQDEVEEATTEALSGCVCVCVCVCVSCSAGASDYFRGA